MPIIDSVYPPLREKALKLQQLALEKHNIKIKFTQGLRTEAVQYALWAKGRLPLVEVNKLLSASGQGVITEAQNKIVTNSRTAANSWHGYGLAFDIVMVMPDGKTLSWADDIDTNRDNITDWDQVGILGSTIGLEWGGNFSSIIDKPHYQNRYGLTLAQIHAAKIPTGVTITRSQILSIKKTA